jgi:hypothetical protein
MEKKLLRDSRICEIDIEKSTKAKHLEAVYSLDWAFSEDTHLDPFFHLRACISSPVKFDPGKIIPIPTGIYPALKSPNFRIEINSYTDLVYEQGLALADGISVFEYTFRNEIWLLIKNNFETAQILRPTQKIATFSTNYRPQMVLNYVDQIQDIAWKNQSKSYIQKIKKKINAELYDKNFDKRSIVLGYSRQAIDSYIDGGFNTANISKISGETKIHTSNLPESSGLKSDDS